MSRTAWIIPLLLVLPLLAGCLTTLAVSAVAGSGSDNEHIEAARQTAREAASAARDKAEEISLSAQDLLDSLRGSGD